jgi:hypothetical protein
MDHNHSTIKGLRDYDSDDYMIKPITPVTFSRQDSITGCVKRINYNVRIMICLNNKIHESFSRPIIQIMVCILIMHIDAIQY